MLRAGQEPRLSQSLEEVNFFSAESLLILQFSPRLGLIHAHLCQSTLQFLKKIIVITEELPVQTE